jgi:cytochrome c5
MALGVGLVAAVAYAVPPGTPDEIRERVQPFGSLCRAGQDCGQATAAAATGPLSGEQVYNQFCFACHASGVGGAPVLGDAAAWEPRIAQGVDTLLQHTLNGINAMPAKGTCMNCSDDELRDAMQYMVDAAGAQ